MDNLIILAGVLAAIRAYWMYNLLREEKGLSKGNISMFLDDENKFLLYILVRPFYKKMKNDKLRLNIHLLSYVRFY
ncbi:hypothetical protein SAMN06265379_103408 [Saccharicrinis carchari]|uniref:Uncharacterized protein n=1 Tax=Saccharicrinis carchari TaxID=1168039 RepID=A0A521CRW8_SACCC|nr:hypothetical protein [Saccharicrinis carchari]SMO62172.1 hypothetical protein SAMN06265379_103408 [Saccharicrinis carchari]